jgi:hypothetical protein
MTKEYLGETIRQKGVLSGPANSTNKKPPSSKNNEIAIFNEDEWSVVPDLRGKIYWLEDGSEITISKINEVIPPNALSEKPDLRTLQQVVSDANDLIKSRHAQVLSDLSGNATVEERDTWPLQKEWAVKYVTSQGEHEKLLLVGLMTQAEINALGDTAAQVMAEKIIAKSAAMDLLTSKAGGLKRTAEEILNSATDKKQIPTILESLEQQMSSAIAEFMAVLNGG